MNYPSLLLHACREDFRTFFRKAFEVLHPTRPLRPGWHHDAIAHTLEELLAGRRRRQIINIPPRMLKSFMISVMWPAFLLGRDPTTKIVVVSYTETLAKELSNHTRRLMNSPFYRELFPGTKLIGQTSLQLDTTAGGSRFSTTIGGALTGLGGEWVILDDPHSATDALSEAKRDGVITFFKQTLLSRFDDPAAGKLVLVMQRLHEADLSGQLIEAGGCELLKLQAIATEDADIPLGGHRIHHVRAGDYLQPDHLTPEYLAAQKRDMGDRFEAQYQQEPAPAVGNQIRRDWLRYTDTSPPRASGVLTLSVDTAIKDHASSDYSVCTAFLDIGGVHHVTDVWREKVGFSTLVERMRGLWAKHRPDHFLIEDAGSGAQLIAELRRHQIMAVPRKATKEKAVRLSAAEPFFLQGDVCLPRYAPWLTDLEKELLAFPNGKHDDQVDTVSQYFMWVVERTNGGQFSFDPMLDAVMPGHDTIAEHLLWGRG